MPGHKNGTHLTPADLDALIEKLRGLDRDDACLKGTQMVPLHRNTLREIAAALAALRADAERYRWLRPHFRAMSLDMGSQHRGWHLRTTIGRLRGPTIDAAIDAAREAKP